jgi:hypothetical protein
MAVSASRSSVPTGSSPSGRLATTVIPTLAPEATSASPTTIGSASTSTIRSAIAWACAASGTVSTTTNSSPPNRATMSACRQRWRSRRATATSTWSPTAWPSPSLTSLNPSRSQNSTASWRSPSSRHRAADSSSISAARLGRPVSSSCVAR